MKCRRRAPGTTGVPIILTHKMQLAGKTPDPGNDQWPICEATIINTHTDHPAVSRISNTHGMIRIMNGQPYLVEFGASVVVDYPPDIDGRDEGQIVHSLADFTRVYDVL